MLPWDLRDSRAARATIPPPVQPPSTLWELQKETQDPRASPRTECPRIRRARPKAGCKSEDHAGQSGSHTLIHHHLSKARAIGEPPCRADHGPPGGDGLFSGIRQQAETGRQRMTPSRTTRPRPSGRTSQTDTRPDWPAVGLLRACGRFQRSKRPVSAPPLPGMTPARRLKIARSCISVSR